MDDWYTHQIRTHFQREIFACGMHLRENPCRRGLDLPIKRKDGFQNHLIRAHGCEPGKALNDEVSKRAITVRGLFHDRCGFCCMKLESRDASMEHIGAHIEHGDHQIMDWVHQCTSLDHNVQRHVHFDLSLDDPEMDGDDSNDDDNDTDEEDLFGWTQGGDYDPSNGEKSSGTGPDQDHNEDWSHGDTGEKPSDGIEQASDSLEYLQSLTVTRTLGRGGSATVYEVNNGDMKQNLALKVIPRKQVGSSEASDIRTFE